MKSSSGGNKPLGPLIGAIDQGSNSTKFFIFTANTAELVTFHELPVTILSPKEGWLEQDPLELIDTVRKCIEAAVENLIELQVDPNDIVSIGITTQRATTVVWDKLTGKPLTNAISWLDTRTSDLEKRILDKLPDEPKKRFFLQHICGLPLSSQFSALKLQWLFENDSTVRKCFDKGRLLFGTPDTWIIWNLTGGNESNDAVHVTDVTNASRTMLMNIETLEWDSDLCKLFKVPMKVLPEIRSSSEVYGKIYGSLLNGVPISGCLGRSQAALVGQNCFRPGQVKCSHGTGSFILCNVGKRQIYSQTGLISTVAYKLGKNEPVHYALEGFIGVSGTAIQWLKEKMKVIECVTEVEKFASSVSDSAGAYFVPALRGLFAPYWIPEARGVLCGLSEHVGREHLCRAILEAIGFQSRDILEAMFKDCQLRTDTLLVDGRMSQNSVLLQIQADLLGIPILRSSMIEATALGVAIASGSAEGIDVWNQNLSNDATFDRFLPRLTDDERDFKYEEWQAALNQSREFCRESEVYANVSSERTSKFRSRLYASVPLTIFAFSSFLLFKLSQSQYEQ